MTRRWPNTPHWRTIERQLREIAGSGWRRLGESAFGVPPGGLRALVDRDMPEPEIADVQRRFGDFLEQRVAALDEHAAREREARAAYAEDCRAQAESRRNRRLADDPGEIELFIEYVIRPTAFFDDDDRERAIAAYRRAA